MGIFSRKPHDGPVAPTNNNTTRHERKPSKQRNTVSMSHRPSFGQWLKSTWLDLFTMVIMGVIGLGLYESPPAVSRSFPVYFQDGEVVYPQYAYPLRNEIVPIWLAAILATLVPIAVFLICQIRVRSFWDLNNATIGLLYSVITAAVFQVFLKTLIGGLRPHFLTVCAPNIPVTTAQETGNGLNMIMYDRTICTGDPDEIDDSLESFPSGHSTAAFAGFVFLSIYLNAKLKLFSNHHTALWKLAATFAPILGATLIAGALTVDEYHHYYDVIAGAIIGTTMAFSAYRMVYASIWDWRTNHIPLNRTVPFQGAGAGADLENATFTRQVGWGRGSSYNDHDGMVQGGEVRNKEYANGIGRKPVGTTSGTGHYNNTDTIV